MDLVNIFQYLEKHISWRNVVILILLVLSFGLGYYYCSAKRDKQEAMLINQHTKEIKSYCDSAIALKKQAMSVEVEQKIIIWKSAKTIDSLESIIQSYKLVNNENNDKQKGFN